MVSGKEICNERPFKVLGLHGLRRSLSGGLSTRDFKVPRRTEDLGCTTRKVWLAVQGAGSVFLRIPCVHTEDHRPSQNKKLSRSDHAT